ncbi:MAG: bifunctional 4-hydroxy-2-oxoglutarate aldolase/2-dehydro-3-deoxy-phosphogluconate aldolase [Pyrinomonadaceae bacterium]|nr:bifunctional 4-hydroxy-2-oxoglutarate aldolase/2-dehydro-3-deoxy-phosphogluconate aldolase [Pyrinomonadaceae bacterium]
MEKIHVIRQIALTGIMPVIRADSHENARRIVEPIRSGGVNIFEITMTVPQAPALIETLRSEYGSDALIGAGTVVSREEASICIGAGAQFIVSPATNFDVISLCIEKEVAILPGALTPTEIVDAWNAGADFVKVFPAGAMGGADFIRSLKAPLPNIELIPTGGVSIENAGDFITAGASAVGIGSELCDLSAAKSGNGRLITERTVRLIDIVNQARQS